MNELIQVKIITDVYIDDLQKYINRWLLLHYQRGGETPDMKWIDNNGEYTVMIIYEVAE